MTLVQSEGAIVAAHLTRPRILRGLEGYGVGDFSDFAALYRTQPNVRLVNGFLARNIAQLGLHAFERVSDNERRRLDAKSSLSRLIRRPNPYVTRYSFVNAMVHDLGIYDVFAALKVRNPATGDLRLFRIPPYMFEPIGDSWIAPDGIRLLGNRERPEFGREQVVYLHGYNPEDSRTGVSPLESLRRILAEEMASGVWREQFWKRSARISGVIERPPEAPKWSDTARNRFRSDWQATYAGAGELAGATPILEEGMVWKDAAFSPKESEYIEARRLSREEVAANYFVSPLFVGILDHANFSNVSEQHKHLYQDTLGPRLVEIEEELELQVLPDFPELDPDLVYLEFNLAEKLKGTFEEQATVLQTLVGAPVLTRNEGRARLNVAPIDGGDSLVTPLNVLVGGQASPRDTAPPATGTASRSGRKSVADLTASVSGWQAKHVEVLGAYFGRQKNTVGQALRDGSSLDTAWDDETWNGALEADLYALSTSMTADLATPVAERFGGTYDEALALGFLATNSRIAAENINATTKSAVADALATTDPELDPFDEADAVFDDEARLDQTSTSRANAVGNFAAHEGAVQAGVTSKVWVINSGRPRSGHPADGETVAIDSTFSNGARWPGDSSAGVDQTAGCTCSLDFSTEEA